MSLIFNYTLSFLFMKYILKMSTTDIIMLQGVVTSIIILYFLKAH